jgi:hypothetical protein
MSRNFRQADPVAIEWTERGVAILLRLCMRPLRIFWWENERDRFETDHFVTHRRKTSRIPVTNIAGVGGQPGI